MILTMLAALAPASALPSAAAPIHPPAVEAPAESALAQCIAAEAEKLDFSGIVSLSRPTGITTYARGRLAGPQSPGIDANTRFNLASAGKMFTAVAVAQLVDAGKIGLDDSIGLHVEGLTREAAAATIRQLLTHRSGLGSFFSPENLPAIERARTVFDLMPLVASERPGFAPGTRFQYSNSGFVLLGRLVERVSGESFGDYLRHHVFGPAGMNSTGLDPNSTGDRAIGMTMMGAFPTLIRPSSGPPPSGAGRNLPPPQGPLRPAPEAALYGNPAGGSYSSAADMRKFFAALQAGRLTSATMLEKLISAQVVAVPRKDGMPELDYGLGFGVGAFEGHRWFGHNGGAPGVNVEANVYPDDRTTLIVMANRDPPAATALFRRLRAILFDPSAPSCNH